TLALGIGANTAVFSITDQVLFRGPPVTEPDRLAAVYTTCRRGFSKCSSSYPDYEDYRDISHSFVDMAAYNSVPLNIDGAASSARLATGQLVTGNYFELLGIRPYLGRLVLPTDNRVESAHVAVLEFGFWTDAFGGDPTVVGRTIRLNGESFTVVGVALPGFHGMSLDTGADVWLPMLAGPALGEAVGAASDPAVFRSRGSRWIQTLIGRLAPGATLVQARSEMDAIARRLGEEYPDEWAALGGARGITVDRSEGYILPVIGESELRRFVWLLFGVVGFTLLLASANVANLLVARATTRRREIGVRLAVGAGRARLIRQFLTESLALGLLGGAAGLAVAQVMLHLLNAFDLPGGVSISSLGVGLDTRVLLFTFLISVLTAMVFGLVPALQATRRDLVTSIKGDSPRGELAFGGGQQRLRKGLVAVQVALCLVLLVGAGLFLRTLRNGLSSDLGFRPDGAAVARFNPGLLRFGPDQTVAFLDQLLERVRGLPQVTVASAATLVPFQAGGFRGTFAEIDGYEAAPDEEIRFDYVLVRRDYFRALGIPVLQGRGIGEEDVTGSRPVAVVNRDAAERYWAGRAVLGSTLTLAGQINVEVVGVVENCAWRQVGDEPTPFVFLAMEQHPDVASGGFLTLVARTSGGTGELLPLVRERFKALRPDLSLTTLATMEQQLGSALMPQRMGSALLTLFGALALVLVSVGIYGVVGYTVTCQAREIGIRMAIGARRATIVGGIVRGMAMPVAIGLAGGGVLALALSRTVESFMFQVDAQDPWTLGAITALLLAVFLVSALVPARKAMKLDPMRVLTSE
ncbi:MAG: ABC transporter permease, partial [Gemmatimonadales bacterium]